MTRMFKVQINLDDMNAQLLGLSIEEMGHWLLGFQLGASGKQYLGSNQIAKQSNIVGLAASSSAHEFYNAQADRGRKSAEARKSKHGSAQPNAVRTPLEPPFEPRFEPVSEPNPELSSNQYLVSSRENPETNNQKQKDNRFAEFWELYDKKEGRAPAQAKWNRMSDTDHQAAINGIENYFLLKPDHKYRKNPTTYLNQRTWEDEAVKNVGDPETIYPKLNAKQDDVDDLGLTYLSPVTGRTYG